MGWGERAAGGNGDRVRVGQGGFGAGWDWKVFLKRISPCLCYAMSSNEFPWGQILSQGLLSLFLKSFAVGLIGVGRLLLGQPLICPCGKKMPRSLWGWGREARLNISMPGLPLGKGSLKSDRAGAVCNVTHPHTMNKQA